MHKELSIVHVARAPVGGIFRHISDLARAQHEAGHAVGLICDSRTGGSLERERIAALGKHLSLGVVRLPMARSISPSDVFSWWAVTRILGKLKPDIVHTHGAKAGVYGRLGAASLRRRGHPVAAFYAPHGGSLHYSASSVSGRVYFNVERMLERVTDGLIHVSAFEAAAYRTKVGAPRCPAHVVHNGLRADEFKPVQRLPSAVDFLFIGELRELKGVDVFIQAVALLKQKGISATAAIVGPGSPSDERRYRTMVEVDGLDTQVVFRAPMPAREALTLARTIVLPSRAESLPYLVLEVAAAGAPLLVTDVGGIPEMFPGGIKRLLPAGDVAALAAAMAEALADPDALAREAMLCQESVKQNFSLAAMAGRIEDLYRGALERRYRVVRASAVPEADFSR